MEIEKVLTEGMSLLASVPGAVVPLLLEVPLPLLLTLLRMLQRRRRRRKNLKRSQTTIWASDCSTKYN